MYAQMMMPTNPNPCNFGYSNYRRWAKPMPFSWPKAISK